MSPSEATPGLTVVAHTLIPKSGDRGRSISEFEAGLVYRVISRTAKATQRNIVSENRTNKQAKQKAFQSIWKMLLHSYLHVSNTE